MKRKKVEKRKKKPAAKRRQARLAKPVVQAIPAIARYTFHHLHIPINIYDARKGQLVYVNEKFIRLTVLSFEECYGQDLSDFKTWIHPDDLNILQTCIGERLQRSCRQLIKDASEKLFYSVNFRVKRKDGKYMNRLAHCSVMEWDENNLPAVTVNLLTDLSAHKRNHKIVLTIHHFNSQEEEWNTVLMEEFLHKPAMLSEREREILSYMLNDKSAREISTITEIKFNTVRTHWHNILQKTGCQTQKELKEMARKEGWM